MISDFVYHVAMFIEGRTLGNIQIETKQQKLFRYSSRDEGMNS